MKNLSVTVAAYLCSLVCTMATITPSGDIPLINGDPALGVSIGGQSCSQSTRSTGDVPSFEDEERTLPNPWPELPLPGSETEDELLRGEAEGTIPSSSLDRRKDDRRPGPDALSFPNWGNLSE